MFQNIPLTLDKQNLLFYLTNAFKDSFNRHASSYSKGLHRVPRGGSVIKLINTAFGSLFN